MHLVTLLSTPSMGGRERIVLELLRSPQFSEFKHTVIFTKNLHGELFHEFKSITPNILLVSLQPNFVYSIRSYGFRKLVESIFHPQFKRRLRNCLTALRPSVVHSHTYNGLEIQAESSLLGIKKPWIFTLHGTKLVSESRIWKQRQLNLVRLLAYPNAYFVCVSKQSMAAFSVGAYFPLGKTRVIYNGIDLDQFMPNTIRHSILRKSLNIPPNATIIGSVGRLSHEKGHTYLIEAAAKVIEKHSDTHFLIAGEGHLRNELKLHITACNVDKNVHLIGSQKDIRPFLREVDIFVLPSITEGLPLALIEALAMGIPCIATNVGGNGEVLRPGSGITVQPRSSDALAEAIQTMLDPIEKQRFVVPPPYINEFSIQRCAQNYADLYRQAVHEKVDLNP